MRNVHRFKLTILCCLCYLTGCAGYPESGRGGLAEQSLNADFSPVMPDEPLGPEHGLRFDWQLSKLHLEMLIQEGAEWCFPAAVVQGKKRQNRIARELEGGLLLDAANDLVIQRKRLNQLEQQLNYVTSHQECQPPGFISQSQQSETDIINQLYDLLNVDNQFAHNSSEINPKYMGHLAKAAHILREYPQLNLSVTGHADATGSVSYNQKLALARAKQVERYLTIFGLDQRRIETHSLGASAPLFEGDSAGILLTNRRVSVEVVSTQGGRYEME